MSQNATGAGVANGNSIQFSYLRNGNPVDDIGWFKGALGQSVQTAFAQTPGPTTVWAIATDPADGANTLANGLAEAAKIAVQIVILANTPLTGTGAGQGQAELEALATHCNTVSNTGADGLARIGVAMLGNGVTDTTLITGTLAQNRMTMIAHHSTEDAAAAVAGVIAGYPPHISLLLKPIAIDMDKVFSDSEIDSFNNARINWVTRTPLIPGAGFYMGEGYTLGADQPYIDIPRTIDEISFDLKAALIRSIGVLRVTRAGLRALVAAMTARIAAIAGRRRHRQLSRLLPAPGAARQESVIVERCRASGDPQCAGDPNRRLGRNHSIRRSDPPPQHHAQV